MVNEGPNLKAEMDQAIRAYYMMHYGQDYICDNYVMVISGEDITSGGCDTYYLFVLGDPQKTDTTEGMTRRLLRWVEGDD